MRNVSRLSEPLSLQRNASTWTKELLDKIKECEANKTRVPKSFYNHYSQDDVKKRLMRMYKELCCYCEGRIGVVEFGHIEHRKPKRKFPEDCYKWDNLHLACTRCNTKKGNKYYLRYSILDAVVNNIPTHLTYHVDRHGIWPKALTKEGETTVRHAELTEERLRRNWLEIFLEAIGMIEQINEEEPDSPDVGRIKAELEAMCRGEYGSVVDYARKKH